MYSILVVIVIVALIFYLLYRYLEWSLANTDNKYAAEPFVLDFYKIIKFWVIYYNKSLSAKYGT